MKKDLPPSRTADQYVVRFPDGMRDQIADAAKAAGRSMNAEIVARLQGSVDGGSDRDVLLDQTRQIFHLRASMAVVHMALVEARDLFRTKELSPRSLAIINDAAEKTGPHAQWLFDMSLDEVNALRARIGYEALDAKAFKGFKTAAERDAAKARDAVESEEAISELPPTPARRMKLTPHK